LGVSSIRSAVVDCGRFWGLIWASINESVEMWRRVCSEVGSGGFSLIQRAAAK